MATDTRVRVFKNLDEVVYTVDGKKHRDDGPAVISPLRKEWWINGERHREDGPAILMNGGSQQYYVKGRLHRKHGPAVNLTNGCLEWWVNGMRHRVDGPAYIYGNSNEWWVNGRLHRVDGPAVLSREQCKWYENGILHRLDGPACINYYTGVKTWYINGVRYNTEAEFIQAKKDLRMEISNILYDTKKICRDVTNYISQFVY